MKQDESKEVQPIMFVLLFGVGTDDVCVLLGGQDVCRVDMGWEGKSNALLQ